MFLLWAMGWSGVVRSADIRYSVIHVGGSIWEYAYTVTHDTPYAGTPLQAFAVGFDPALYREPSLEAVTRSPLSGEWNERFLASSLALGSFYDVEAGVGGLAAGTSASGFRVRFEWTGNGTPGTQPFWIFAPGDPAPQQRGHTAPASSAAIPFGGPWLNGVLALALLSLAALRLWVRRRVEDD